MAITHRINDEFLCILKHALSSFSITRYLYIKNIVYGVYVKKKNGCNKTCTIVSHVAAGVQTTGFCIMYMSIDGTICIHTQIS